MNIEQIALETWREIHGFAAVFMRDAQVEFLRRCLAKLAVQDVEPIYQLSKANSSVSSAWIDVDEQTYSDAGLYPEYGRRRLYPEAQLLAAQQRTAEACAKLCGYMITPSKSLSDHPYQAWLAGITQCAEAINNGEWRNYK